MANQSSSSPRLLALLSLLAVAGFQHRDKLQGILDSITGRKPAGQQPGMGRTQQAGQSGQPQPGMAQAGAMGGLGGLLSGLFGGGGASSGGIGGALSELVGQFASSGHGEEVRSWVAAGPNRDVPPDAMEEALGEDTLRALSEKTGLSRQEIVDRLRTVLPAAVDKLTPEGRLPTRDEEMNWARTAKAA